MITRRRPGGTEQRSVTANLVPLRRFLREHTIPMLLSGTCSASDYCEPCHLLWQSSDKVRVTHDHLRVFRPMQFWISVGVQKMLKSLQLELHCWQKCFLRDSENYNAVNNHDQESSIQKQKKNGRKCQCIQRHRGEVYLDDCISMDSLMFSKATYMLQGGPG